MAKMNEEIKTLMLGLIEDLQTDLFKLKEEMDHENLTDYEIILSDVWQTWRFHDKQLQALQEKEKRLQKKVEGVK